MQKSLSWWDTYCTKIQYLRTIYARTKAPDYLTRNIPWPHPSQNPRFCFHDFRL